MLTFKVFDPKVGDWLQDAQGNFVKERLDNTILENLLPDEQFSFGLVDDATTAADLQNNHPDGHKLLLSSGSRFVFGSETAQAAMETIFPEAPENGLHGMKDRGAYGALLIGECDNSKQIIQVLAIDRSGEFDANADPTGISQQDRDNAAKTEAEIANGLISLDSAKLTIYQDQLKGFQPAVTCLVAIPLNDLTERTGVRIYTPSSIIQKSLTILIVDDETGDNDGLLPNNIARELTGDCHGRICRHSARNYGLQIKDGSGATDEMVQFRAILLNFDNDLNAPGIHKIAKGTLLGQDLSKLPWQLPEGKIPPDLIMARSSFKGATKPQVGLHQKEIWLGAKSVSANGKMSVSSLIPLYPGLLKDVQPCLEPKMAALAAAQNNPMALAKLYIKSSQDRKQLHELSDDSSDVTLIDSRPDSPELKFIRAAVESNNPAALKTPLAVKELKKFVKNKWKSLALGQDKSIAFERSMALPDKNLANGEICVPWLENGEELIVYRPPVINTNGIHILTNKLDTSIPYSKESKYIAISDQNPIGQSIMADMALDFDGDHVAFARASDYPNLAREVKLKQNNRYPDVVKEKKQEFEGVSQEEAALQMARSPVGLIANSLIAIQSEISATESMQNPNNSWVKPEDRTKFASEVQQTMRKVLGSVTPEFPYLVRRPNNLSEEGKKAFGISSAKITKLATDIAAHDPKDAYQILGDYKLLLREVVGVASGQNQIAVDMPKSSRVADEKATMNGTKFLAHKSTLQQEKKLTDLYLNRTLTANGISPPEILAATTNQYFVENKLLQTPPSQFKELFAGVEYDPIQKAQANGYQTQFQKAWVEASSRLKKEQNESGVSMQLWTADDKLIEVTNLHRGESEFNYSPERMTEVTIEPKPTFQGRKNYHTFQVLDARGKKIGDLCELSAKELDVSKVTTSFDIGEGKLKSRQELSGLYFAEARKIAADFADSIPPEERKAYTAALWAEATKETAKDSQEQTIPKAVLYAFPNELADQVSNTNMNRVHVKLKAPIEHSEDSQTFKAVTANDNGKLQTTLFDESSESIGYISQMGYPVTSGTLYGTLSPDAVAVLQVKIPEISAPLTVGKVNEFALAGQPINTINADITIQPVKIDSYRLAINGKPISDTLSKEATDFVTATGLNDGQPFTTAVVARVVDEKRSALYLNFDDGSMVQCVSTDTSLPHYQGEEVELSIINSPQYTAGVFLRDAEGQVQQIGEFTAWTGKATEGALSPRQSLELLVQKTPLNAEINGRGGVDRSQPLSGSFNTAATISTDGTNQILEIKAQDLNPPSWQLQERPEKSADVPINERLRAFNSQKSPVMLENSARSILAVDNSIGSAATDWAKKNGATIITGGDFSREIDRGFVVIEIETESISPALRQKMVEQGMVTITTKPQVYDQLIEKIPAPQQIFDGNVAGVNIASNSTDPLGQQIAAMLRENHAKDKPLEDIARLTIEKNPELVRTIAANGGDAWLEKCEHQGRTELSGRGTKSPLVKALSTAYTESRSVRVVTKSEDEEKAAVVPKVSAKSSKDKPKKSRAMSM